jgi:hypothetical protein
MSCWQFGVELSHRVKQLWQNGDFADDDAKLKATMWKLLAKFVIGYDIIVSEMVDWDRSGIWFVAHL